MGDDAMTAGELTKEMSMERSMQRAEDQVGGGGLGEAHSSEEEEDLHHSKRLVDTEMGG